MLKLKQEWWHYYRNKDIQTLICIFLNNWAGLSNALNICLKKEVCDDFLSANVVKSRPNVAWTFLCAHREANTIFRGNSLATRCIDDMMKIVGKNYLAVTLKPVIDEVWVTRIHTRTHTRAHTHTQCIWQGVPWVTEVSMETSSWTVTNKQMCRPNL